MDEQATLIKDLRENYATVPEPGGKLRHPMLESASSRDRKALLSALEKKRKAAAAPQTHSDGRNPGDKFEALMDTLIIYCSEESFKMSLNKLLAEFLDQNGHLTGCSYRILVTEDTNDVMTSVIGEIKHGRLSGELGTSNHPGEEENRMTKLMSNFDGLKEIYNDP